MSSTDWNELDGYEALVSELRATAPAAPESLRQRVLGGAPAPRHRMTKRRRLTFVVVPVAVVLGFVSTGSRSSLNAPNLGVRLNPRVPGSSTTADSGALTNQKARHSPAATDFGSAYKSAQGYALDQEQAVASSTAHGAVAIPSHRLVHAVASLEVRVKSRSDLSAKTNRASQIVGSFGGYAQSVRYQNSSGYGESVLELRVPVEKANAALAKLSTLGQVVSQQVSTQDLQNKLTHENSGIGSLRRAIAVYENALNSGTLSGSQRVIIQIKLNNARHALSKLRHARTGTLASGATASISLLLTTRNQAVVAHHHHKQGRLGRLLGSAAGFLGLEGIIALYALIVLSPIALLAVLAWWVLRERRRREERLLASA
jgi:Domain of unknown function (DUF4349)